MSFTFPIEPLPGSTPDEPVLPGFEEPSTDADADEDPRKSPEVDPMTYPEADPDV